MIDYADEKQLWALSNQATELANQYRVARHKAAEAKYRLDIILASKMNEFRKVKSSIGYDMARIMLLEEGNEDIKNYYKEEEKWTADYKGLEKVLDALHGQIILAQSLIKNKKQEGV